MLGNPLIIMGRDMEAAPANIKKGEKRAKIFYSKCFNQYTKQLLMFNKATPPPPEQGE